MSEYGGAGLKALFAMIDNAIPNAVNAGIVGNVAHHSGYHRSRNVLLSTGHTSDYSIQAAADKRGPGDACSGLDVSWPFEYMQLVTKRMVEACERNDPRVYALREIIGTLDGKNVCGYNRVASGSGTRSKVGFVATGFADSSHLWHNHFSILREFADDVVACKAIGAVAIGLPQPQPLPAPKIVINGKEYDDLTSVSVAGVNLARDTGLFSRHVWYVQTWLTKFYGLPHLDGFWDDELQRGMNDFRRSLGWTGTDVIGGVGLTSLSTLASKAGSTKPVRV
jgi:hypothetical protein